MARPASHVIFLNRFFYPDHSATSQMLSDLAFALAGQGYRLSVITSRQRYDAPSARLPNRRGIAGVDVHRVPTSRFGRHFLPGRFVDYLSFYVSAAWSAVAPRASRRHYRRENRPADALTARRAHRAPSTGARLVNWLQDLFPEVAEELKVGGGLARAAYGPLRWLRDRSLASADMNVVLGEANGSTSSQALVVKPSRVRVIPNWADGDLIRPIEHPANALRRQWGLGDALTVGYAGNLGRAHDIDTMLEAIAGTQTEQPPLQPSSFQAAPSSVAGFSSGVARYSKLEVCSLSPKVSNVEFKPYQPRERLAESLFGRRRASRLASPRTRRLDCPEQILRHRCRRPPDDFHRRSGWRDCTPDRQVRVRTYGEAGRRIGPRAGHMGTRFEPGAAQSYGQTRTRSFRCGIHEINCRRALGKAAARYWDARAARGRC